MTLPLITLENAKLIAERLGLTVCSEGLHGGCGQTLGCNGDFEIDESEWDRLMEFRASSNAEGFGVFVPAATFPRAKASRITSYNLKHDVEKALPGDHKYISNATMILYLAAIGVVIQPVPGSKNPYVRVKMV